MGATPIKMNMHTYPTEPLDLMQHINRRFHEPVMHCRVVLDRPIDACRLAEAVGRQNGLFPLLGCIYDAERNLFVEREGRRPVCETVGKQDHGAADPRGDAWLFTRLDPSRETARFTLCGNRLYITVSHLLCSGADARVRPVRGDV